MIDYLFHEMLIHHGFIIPISYVLYGNVFKRFIMGKAYHYKYLIPMSAIFYAGFIHFTTHMLFDFPYDSFLHCLEVIITQGFVSVGLYETVKCTYRFNIQRKLFRDRVIHGEIKK